MTFRSAPALALGIALLAPATARAQSTACAPELAGGVVVSENRGAIGARIAATPLGVAVSWVERRRFGNPDFGREQAAHLMARALDGASMTPRAAAIEVFAQTWPYEVVMGPVLIPQASGDIAAGLCLCVGGSADTSCTLSSVVGSAPTRDLRPAHRQSGVCTSGELAATAIGDDVLLASPFADADGLRMYGTAVRAIQDVALEDRVDAPTMAAVGSDRAAWFRRTPQGIELRLFDVRGNARGRPLLVSPEGARVGAPFALAMPGDSVVVAFSVRRGRGPWRIHLATWANGAVTHRELDTGPSAAVAPSLAPASNHCLALAWTEGAGRTTTARVGRVCNGVIEPGSVAQLSQPGVEAGDAELASDGTHLYAVWQQLPAARGARAELRAARLACR
jgi:hypothetical protein